MQAKEYLRSLDSIEDEAKNIQKLCHWMRDNANKSEKLTQALRSYEINIEKNIQWLTGIFIQINQYRDDLKITPTFETFNNITRLNLSFRSKYVLMAIPLNAVHEHIKNDNQKTNQNPSQQRSQFDRLISAINYQVQEMNSSKRNKWYIDPSKTTAKMKAIGTALQALQKEATDSNNAHEITQKLLNYINSARNGHAITENDNAAKLIKALLINRSRNWIPSSKTTTIIKELHARTALIFGNQANTNKPAASNTLTAMAGN